MSRQSDEDTFQVLQHIVVPEPQHAEVVRRQPAIAYGVSFRLGMLSAIDLNNQSRSEAKKISYVRSNRNLSAKFEIGKSAVAQGKPQLAFGICHARTRFSSRSSVLVGPLTRLAPAALGTLSRRGRGFHRTVSHRTHRATSHVVPSLESLMAMPMAASSSRMRSDSLKSLRARAAVRSSMRLLTAAASTTTR